MKITNLLMNVVQFMFYLFIITLGMCMWWNYVVVNGYYVWV